MRYILKVIYKSGRVISFKCSTLSASYIYAGYVICTEPNVSQVRILRKYGQCFAVVNPDVIASIKSQLQ